MIQETTLTDREWLLLSAYLDEQLSETEKRQVEDLLQNKPASLKALEGLRRTRQVLRYAPLRKVSHNFTLSPEQVRKPFLPSFSRVLSYSSALAALLLVVVLGIDLFSGSALMTAAPVPAAAAQERAVMAEADQSAKVAAQKIPQIIYWNGVNAPLMGVYGKGGGGGKSGTAGYANGIGGGGGGAEGAGMAAAPLAEAAPTVKEALPETQQALPTETAVAAAPEMAPESAPLQAQPESGAAAAAAPAPNAAISASPIMGIHPAGERGMIHTLDGTVIAAPSGQPFSGQPFSWRLVEIILAIAAVLTGLGALLLRKRR